MQKGTKSILFGVHCFFIHPIIVFIAWWKIYGFPRDPRLWVAFFVHDLGYWGKKNMDDEDGENHPYLGAKIMHRLFDERIQIHPHIIQITGTKWYDFTLYHSRFLAKKNGKQYSKLCVADKYAIVIEPSWLYLPRAWASGELKEYMKDAEKNSNGTIKAISALQWHRDVKKYVKSWVEEHKDLKEDNWTTTNRKNQTQSGVWK